MGSWTWAASGLVRLAGGGSVTLSILEDEALLPFWRSVFKVGKSEEGELRLLGAPGQPQAACSVSNLVDSGEL